MPYVKHSESEDRNIFQQHFSAKLYWQLCSALFLLSPSLLLLPPIFPTGSPNYLPTCFTSTWLLIISLPVVSTFPVFSTSYLPVVLLIYILTCFICNYLPTYLLLPTFSLSILPFTVFSLLLSLSLLAFYLPSCLLPAVSSVLPDITEVTGR